MPQPHSTAAPASPWHGPRATAGFPPPAAEAKEALAWLNTLDPVGVDADLAGVVALLAHREDAVAALAARLAARHPLLALAQGDWEPQGRAETYQRVFFPSEQIAGAAAALHQAVRQTPREHGARLAQSLAEFEGLATVVSPRDLPLHPEDYGLYTMLRAGKEMREFENQVMVVLNYQCNLRCSYCFSDELLQRLSQPLEWDQFQRCLDWIVKSGATRAPVTGGEPTIYPHFQRCMEEIQRRGLATYFATNGLGPTEAYRPLHRDFVESVTFHILDDAEYGPGTLDHLKTNIRTTQDRGIPIVLRYVLRHPQAEPWETLLGLTREFQPASVSFSPVFPGPGRKDMTRDVGGVIAMGPRVLELARQVCAAGVRPVLSKPVPACAFNREQLLWLTAAADVQFVCDISRNGFANNTLINPDLTLYPCMALALGRTRLADTEDLQAFGQVAQRVLRPILGTPMLPECRGCQLFGLRMCQAACYSFAVPPA